MWWSIGALLLIAYAPGALLFRLPAGDRPSRASLGPDERAFWAIMLSLAWSSLAGLALAAAHLYTFNRLLAADAALCVAILAGARGRLRYQGETSWNVAAAGGALMPLAIALFGWWIFFFVPPAEYIIGGKDPGVYMNEGIQIAQRGGLVTRDPVIAGTPAASRDLFFPSHQNPSYYGLRFMGFFITDPSSGEVVGQFPHFYPLWIAIGYGVDGLTGARRVAPAWATLGLLAVYFVGANLIGRAAAGAAAILLAINAAELWFARYPNSEVVQQALLFAALLAFTRAHDDRRGFFGAAAGVLFGLLLFVRFDAAIAYAAAAAACVIGIVNKKPPRASFLAAAFVTTSAAAAYLLVDMRPYVAFPLAFLRNLQAWQAASLCGAALVAVSLIVVARREQPARYILRATPPAIAIAMTALACYAWFMRSTTGRTAIHDAMSLHTFAWYVTTPGVALALLGFVLLTLRSFWRSPVFVITAATYAVFFFYKIRIVPDHFWMARRFTPVILPAALLCVAAAAFDGRRRDARGTAAPPRAKAWLSRALDVVAPGRSVAARAMNVVVPMAIVALLARTFLEASAPLLRHVEYAGLIPHLEQLAERFGPDDLVLVESRNASDVHVLATPLAYIYARNVLLLNSPRPDKSAFRGFLDWARTRYRAIYFIGGGGTDLLSRSVAVQPVASERFQVPEYDSPTNAYPSGVRRKEFDFGVYRFVQPTASAGPFRLDVGVEDDLLVVRFHAKETDGSGRTFRWTRDASYISIVGVSRDVSAVTLWMNDGRRPPAAPRARAAISLNDRPLGDVEVGSDFREYTFAIPSDLASAAAEMEDPATLKITTSTWSPRATIGAPDDRDLGVMVDRVEVR